MTDLIPYQGENFVVNHHEVAAAQVDARFIALWLHGKSEKTKRAYVSDVLRFYDTVHKSLQQVKPTQRMLDTYC